MATALKVPTRECDDSTRIMKKIVIVGDGACGKTSLLWVYLSNTFPETSMTTIFDTQMCEVKADDKKITLGMWDTSGLDVYDRLRPLSYPNADAILMCFSVVAPRSLENVVEKWAPEVNHYCADVPVILVGTKTDLRNDQQTLQNLVTRQQVPVTAKIGKRIANKINAYAYAECSAYTKEGVDAVFHEAIRATLSERQSQIKKKRRICCGLL